jgi:transcriptional antiterminator RfaH
MGGSLGSCAPSPSPDQPELPWYVIRTKPHQERRAEFHIKQLGVETFLPLLRQGKTSRHAPKTVIAPLFPGYFFARFDIQRHYRAVSYAGGVHKIVEFGGKPARVSEVLIEAIKGNMDNGYVTVKPHRLQKGQIVQINGGPLAGLQAVFVREMPERNRVLLLFKALGFHARLVLAAEDVGLAQAL